MQKKLLLFLVLSSLILFAFSANATVQVQLLDQTFTRGTGTPIQQRATFPSANGQVYIKLYNGIQDSNADKVSSAVITINGSTVFDQSQFNQKVSYLEKNITLSQGLNTLTVTLNSKPGSRIRIQIMQQLEAAAGGLIGPDGGIIAVNDLSSDLYGFKIQIPPGSIKELAIITIGNASTVPVVPLPDNFFQDDPMVSINSTIPLSAPVIIDVPFKGPFLEDELRVFLHFDSKTESWNFVAPMRGKDPGVMKALTNSFSIFTKAKSIFFGSSLYSGFKIEQDSLAAVNDIETGKKYPCAYNKGGLCAGMSLIAEDYFNHFFKKNNIGLKCWWTEFTSWNAACQATGAVHKDWKSIFDIFFGQIIDALSDDYFLIQYLKGRLQLKLTSSIDMLGWDEFETKIVGHSVLVTGWEKTGFGTGKFIIYDNQDNTKTRDLTYGSTGPLSPIKLTLMSYRDTNETLYFFFLSSHGILPINFFSTDNIIASFPRDNFNDCPKKIAIKLPRTGQTSCYDTSGTQMTCTGTGQDGAIQAGVAWPNPRFSPSGDCVTDNLTGLMWAKNANNGRMNWQNALNYVASINSGAGLCNQSDWRLPNVNELESLIHLGQNPPSDWLNSQGFSSVNPSWYWTSTTQSYFKNWAMIVDMGTYGSRVDNDNKSYNFNVWMVRGGRVGSTGNSNIWRTGMSKCYDTSGIERPCSGTGEDGEKQAGMPWPDERFKDNGNQTITDNLTGLLWAKDAGTPGPPQCNPGGTKSWQAALDHIACLNSNQYLGISDWRLPNRKELYSLTDFSTMFPAIQIGHPFINVYMRYWSSSTLQWATSYAWNVYPGQMGAPAYQSKANNQEDYVWPVSGGQ